MPLHHSSKTQKTKPRKQNPHSLSGGGIKKKLLITYWLFRLFRLFHQFRLSFRYRRR
jgi:hypothetical protein